MAEKFSEKTEAVVNAFNRLGGNVSATARELGLHRSSVQRHLRKVGGVRKPVVGGVVEPTIPKAPLPANGSVKRYILTSAQNNTHLHECLWNNLLALQEHYDAELLVGTYSYNLNAYGPLSVKRGTSKKGDRELWFDERCQPFISDSHLEIAKGLVWCGEMNVTPTATDPLSGLETYSGRKSGIFPHAKHAMRSIATMSGEGVKINYTTGTITQRNYIQKKAGLVASHHHTYGAIIVEVDCEGHWWVRQLQADKNGDIYDLSILVSGGVVHQKQRVEAITWGDLHATILDGSVGVLALGKGGMLEVLRPKYQFIHDLMEGASVNHHAAKDPHEKFKTFLRGFDFVEAELSSTAQLLRSYNRKNTQTVVVDSNHDHWFFKWLKEHDYRSDPRNALLFLEAQTNVYKSMLLNEKFNLTEWLMRRHNCPDETKFLVTDESFKICNGRIEAGMHGHLGPNGARGSASNLRKVGRRANIGHIHSAGIYDGLFVAGTSTCLNMGYNRGPSSWTHSHIVTYPNGKRCIVTMYSGKWKA